METDAYKESTVITVFVKIHNLGIGQSKSARGL